MNVIFLGRYCLDEILRGPEKVAKRIFEVHSKIYTTYFIEYFFDGKVYGYFRKLFGKEKVRAINKGMVYRLGIIPMILFILKQKPDIIHIITYERFAVFAFIARIFRKFKIMYNLHGIVTYENKNYRKVSFLTSLKDIIIEKFVINHSDLILYLSVESKNILKSIYKIENDRLFLISNGIDKVFLDSYLKKCFNTENILKIVYISDVTRPEKGFGYLSEVLEKINFKMKLIIIDKKNVLNNIKITNELIITETFDKMNPEELSLFLEDKDVFISAATYEPFSISTMEATATGLIPVVTKQTGASRLIKDKISGFVFNYGDIKSAVNILTKIASDSNIKKEIYNNSKNLYDSLSWNNIYQNYENIYLFLLK